MNCGQFRISSFGLVAALALSGCGGGGNSQMSLLEKWQRFEDGNPTLRMTGAEVSEAWMAAQRSPDSLYISVQQTVGGAPRAVVHRFRCSGEDCGEEEESGAVAVAPVLQHNNVPVAKAEGRITFTDEGETYLSDLLIYGGWLDHTEFRVQMSLSCMAGAPGCSGTDPDYDDDEAYLAGSVSGNATGTPPAGMGSATWTGVMVGMESPEYGSSAALALLAGERQPDVFLGAAGITIDDLSNPDVDVSFTDIHNVTEGTRQGNMTWENLRLQDDGLFGGLTGEDRDGSEYIAGMFTGPGHREVGGEFRRDGIAGAFGAKRR